MDEPKKTSYSEYYKSLNRDKFSQKEKQSSLGGEQEKISQKPREEYSPKYTPSIKQYYATKEKDNLNFEIKKEYAEGTVKKKPKLSPEKFNQIFISAKSTDIDNPLNKVTSKGFSIYPTPTKCDTIKGIGYNKTNKIEKIIEKETVKRPIIYLNKKDIKYKKNTASKIIYFSLGLLFLILIIYSLFYASKNPSLILLILILLAIALFLYFLYIPYQKWIIHANKNLILILVYILLVINMILGVKVYTVEWAFLIFVMGAVIFYDSRIDARFLILPALLLLGYIPFLLIGKQNSLAEIIAVYVYYFLVMGVGLMVFEYSSKEENSLDFEYLIWEIIKKINWITAIVIVGIINVIIIIANRFYNLEIWKWTFVYIFAVSLVFYFISLMKNER